MGLAILAYKILFDKVSIFGVLVRVIVGRKIDSDLTFFHFDSVQISNSTQGHFMVRVFTEREPTALACGVPRWWDILGDHWPDPLAVLSQFFLSDIKRDVPNKHFF
jgi:hypothetical protein